MYGGEEELLQAQLQCQGRYRGHSRRQAGRPQDGRRVQQLHAQREYRALLYLRRAQHVRRQGHHREGDPSGGERGRGQGLHPECARGRRQELHHVVEKANSICFRKVKETIELLNISKTYFQMEVKKRMRDPRPERAFTLSPFSKPNPYVISEEIKTCSEEEISRLHACLRKIKHDKSKDEEESCIKPLVYKIKMVKDDVDLNWKAPQSSYGHLEKLTAEFVILESFNNETAELLSKESKSEKTDCRMLVRKNFSKNPSCAGCVKELNPSCQCYVAYRSFRTEVEIISYIRNVITESIAEYFLEDNPRQQNEIENLYSQYYSQSLLGFNITSKQLLLFVIQLIEGLKMLNTSYVIHRDLKPNNIMISFKRGPKIIDFGSAYELKGNISDKKIGQELLTTKKYNLLYSEAEFPEKYQMAPHEFERHPLYDIYAFGVIVKELYSNPSLCSELGNLVVANLAWLVRMCTLENPDARISHDEALYFCHMLYRIWAAKNGFFSL